jgi:hypothetical protein
LVLVLPSQSAQRGTTRNHTQPFLPSPFVWAIMPPGRSARAMLALLLFTAFVSMRCDTPSCPINRIALRYGWPLQTAPIDDGAPVAGAPSAAVARTAIACCDACMAANPCAAFAFRSTDGLCLLLPTLHASVALDKSWNAGQGGWLTAEMGAPPRDACEPAAVSNTPSGVVLSSMRAQTAELIARVFQFWRAHGPDTSQPGSFHTTLSATGAAVPPTAKTARGQAEDLAAMSKLAMRARRLGDVATSQRAQSLADGLFTFMVRTFTPANGTALVNDLGSGAITPQLLTTHFAVITALATYAQAVPNATIAAAALAAATRQAAAAAACCLDASGGGYVVKEEMAEGWFPAGTAKTLGTHLGALGAGSALRNASAVRRLALNTGVDLASPAGMANLVRATRHVLVMPASGAAPYAPPYFGAAWKPLTPAASLVEYGPSMSVLPSLLDAARALSVSAEPDLVRIAALVATAAAAVGYDPVTGGFYEKGIPGAGPSGSDQKLYYVQTSAISSLISLFRHTKDRTLLCKAEATLRRLGARQLAPAGEFFWAVSDDAHASTPVGMHGSLLAEPWKGAGALTGLVQIADLLDEIQKAEADAADAQPPVPSPAWNTTVSTALPVALAGNASSPPCVAGLMSSLRAAGPLAGLASSLTLPAHAVDVRTGASPHSCCAACMAVLQCDGVAFDAKSGTCALLRGNHSVKAQLPRWHTAPASRPPLSSRVLGACPAALPSLAIDVAASALAGIAGKSGPGPASTAVRLLLAICAPQAAQAEWRGSAHVRGESSRRDYAKRSLALKLDAASAANTLTAAVGWRPSGETRSVILYASYDDVTGLRDALTFNRSAAVGLPAPRTGPLELTAGGSPQGLYYVTQRPDDVARDAGKHMLVASFDPWDDGPDDVFIPLPPQMGSRLRMVHPSRPSAQQVGRFSSAMAALVNATVGSTCDWDAIQSAADTKALVAFFVLTELSNDPDAYAKSTYISLRESDGRLVLGPLWDKNLAFGGSSESTAAGWRALAPCTASCDILDNAASVFGMLAKQCTPFMSAAGAMWTAARAHGGPLSDAAVGAVVREMAQRLKASGAIERDRQVWPRSGRGFDGEVQGLLGWLQARSSWMDAHFM